MILSCYVNGMVIKPDACWAGLQDQYTAKVVELGDTLPTLIKYGYTVMFLSAHHQNANNGLN